MKLKWHQRHPEESRAQVRRWRAANPQKHRDSVRASRLKYPERHKAYEKTNRAQKQAVIRALKAYPCQDCGGVFPAVAMDFDHVRGEKIAGVAAMTGGSWDTLFAEIDKCDLVCANCHRVRTHQRRGVA